MHTYSDDAELELFACSFGFQKYKFCVREQICLKTKWGLWHGAWFSFSSSFSFFLAGAHFQIMSRREWIYKSNNFLVRQNNYALFFQNSIILWQYSILCRWWCNTCRRHKGLPPGLARVPVVGLLINNPSLISSLFKLQCFSPCCSYLYIYSQLGW